MESRWTPRTVELRSPGFEVASDFTSVNDSDVVGLRWPGGVMKLELYPTNAHVFLSVRGHGNATQYGLPPGSETIYQARIAAGDYLIWIYPRDRKAPLAPYSLTLSAPN